jgi:hypothetical protein
MFTADLEVFVNLKTLTERVKVCINCSFAVKNAEQEYYINRQFEKKAPRGNWTAESDAMVVWIL